MSKSVMLLVDFVHGEVREVTESEHREMVVEQMRRTTVKGGVVYVDCEPPK
jgi:hypothetical protein